MADELEDMLVRAIVRKAPSVDPEQAAYVAGYFRTLLNNDRRVLAKHVSIKLTLAGEKLETIERVSNIMENYDG